MHFYVSIPTVEGGGYSDQWVTCVGQLGWGQGPGAGYAPCLPADLRKAVRGGAQ